MARLSEQFAREVVKVASQESKPGVLGAVLAGAPVATLSALSEFPKGYVEKAVEQKISGVAHKAKATRLRHGLGLSAGRLGVGLVTTPVFLSGIKDIQSGDKTTGYAKIVGSGALFSAGKRGIAGLLTPGKGLAKSRSAHLRGLAAANAVLGAGSGLLTADAVAKATKNPEGKNFSQKYLAPAAVGALAGGGKGLFEGGASAASNLRGLKSVRGVRGLGGTVGGRAASGALGAVALTKIIGSFMPKTANVHPPPALPLPTPTQVYVDTQAWARKAPGPILMQNLAEVQKYEPEATPVRRATYYALSDEALRRGHPIPKSPLRDTVVPPSGSTAAALVTTIAPIAGAHALFAAMAHLPEREQALLVSDALDKVRVQMNVGKNVLDSAVNSAFDLDKNRIEVTARPAPGILAHELGHAQARHGGGIWRGVGTAAGMIGIFMALKQAANFDPAFATPEEVQAKANFLTAVGVVTGGAQIPTLAEELDASVRGVKLMRQAKAPIREIIRGAAKHMIPGGATYAAMAAAPLLTAAYFHNLARKKRKLRDRQ